MEDTLTGLVEVWEPLLTTEETVWETRGPIWARIWATRSEVEEEEVVVEEPGLRMRRESWPVEENCPEVRELVDVVDCPPVLDDCPATADVTV